MKGGIHGIIVLCLLAGLSFSNTGIAQRTQLTGYAVDRKTGAPLPYASVYATGSKTGTYTDLNGRFQLSINLPDTLVVRYLGYFTAKVSVSDTSINIRLNPRSESLKEFSIIGDNKLLYAMIGKVRKSDHKKVARAKSYLSIESFIGETQVEMLESYYNGVYKGLDLDELNFKNGRLSLEPVGKGFFISKEVASVFYKYKLFESSHLFAVTPLQLKRRELEKTYYLSLSKRFKNDEGHVVYQILATPNPEKKRTAFESRIWVDSTNMRLIKVSFSIDSADIHPFEPLFDTDTLVNVNLQIVRDFTYVNGVQYYNHTNFNYDLSYASRTRVTRHITSNAGLWAYDFTSEFVLPFFDFSGTQHHDYAKIGALPYSEAFWKSDQGFSMERRKGKIERIFEDTSRMTNSEIFKSSRYFKSGVYEFPYVPWDKFRVRFRTMRDSSSDYTEYKEWLPMDRYKLKVQIYSDINPDGDSIALKTLTVFDPFDSFYHYPPSVEASVFINIYFDLMEIWRRQMVRVFPSKELTLWEARDWIDRELKSIDKRSEKYLREVDRGTNIRELLKWNTYVKENLDIDNVYMFELEY